MSETKYEWGIDYHDGCGKRVCDEEWRVRTWAEYWNEHRIDSSSPMATVHRRTVTTTDWSDSADLPTTSPERLREAKTTTEGSRRA